MRKKNELTVTEGASPINYANEFLKNGGDLEHLEKMMELQERHEANQAKKAFHAAMSEFKKNPPEILKSKKVSYTTDKGTTEYNHSDLGEITTVVGAALAEHGLNTTWKTEQETGIRVTCTITHELGHSQSTSLFSPPDTSGGKNTIQAIGSTITYLQRYTLLALIGLAAIDQDDDGKGSDGTGLSDTVKQEISLLSTIDDLTVYYKENIKNVEQKKDFVAVLAERKAEIVKEMQDEDS